MHERHERTLKTQKKKIKWRVPSFGLRNFRCINCNIEWGQMKIESDQRTKVEHGNCSERIVDCV